MGTLVYSLSFVLPSQNLLPTDFDYMLSYVVAQAYQFNFIFPFSTFFVILGFVFVVIIAEFVFRMGLFALRMIRGV